jgi:hypothetical protein
MHTHQILDDLIALLEANGVKVRMESLDESPGGLCRLREQNILFLDKDAGDDRQIEVCAAAVLKLIDVGTVYLKPEVRQLLERFQSTADTPLHYPGF